MSVGLSEGEKLHFHPHIGELFFQGGGFSSVLRPCDQYPDPPVKLRSRSQASNISHRFVCVCVCV